MALTYVTTCILAITSLFQIGVLSVEKVYTENLKRYNSYYKLDKGFAYVVSDLKPCGQLSRSYCLIQQKIFYSSCYPTKKLAILLCSCDGSQLQKERLLLTNPHITESLEGFFERER